MDAVSVKDWDEVATMILESYRLIAPRKTLAKLEGASSAPAKEAAEKLSSRGTGSTAKARRR